VGADGLNPSKFTVKTSKLNLLLPDKVSSLHTTVLRSPPPNQA